MYDVAGRLDPDSYFLLARAVFREMVAAGWTTVGEFHYLHHQPDGTPYDDPNAMGHALVAAGGEAGIRIALIDTCYLAGGFGEPLGPAQRRFGDGDADAWAARVEKIDHDQVGAAVHSVRAVPADQLPTVAAAAEGRPLHVHVSEQVAENEGCVASYGLTPTALLAEHGVLGPLTSAVHATHLTDADIALLADSGTTASFCPTTERDLGDGIGPARQLLAAGVPLSLGSDSHAVVDPFEEMKALELNERLAAQERGCLSAAELLTAATAHGGLGVPDAGAIAVGSRADLVTLDTASTRTAGTGADEHTAVFAATAADVRQVVVDGHIVFAGEHADVGRELDEAIGALWK
jgi:formiminoglutamate deiminase